MCTNSKGDPLSANCIKRNHVTIMADKRIVMGEGGQILGNEGMRGELQVSRGLWHMPSGRSIVHAIDHKRP